MKTTANSFEGSIYNVGRPVRTSCNDFTPIGIVDVEIHSPRQGVEYEALDGGHLAEVETVWPGGRRIQTIVGTWANPRSARGSHFND